MRFNKAVAGLLLSAFLFAQADKGTEHNNQVNQILFVIEESPLFYYENTLLTGNKDQLPISDNENTKSAIERLEQSLQQVFIENNIGVELIIVPFGKMPEKISEQNISTIPDIQISIILSDLVYTEAPEVYQSKKKFNFDILAIDYQSKKEILKTVINTSDVQSGLYIANKLIRELENNGFTTY